MFDIPGNNRKTIECVTSVVFKPSKYPYLYQLILSPFVFMFNYHGTMEPRNLNMTFLFIALDVYE